MSFETKSGQNKGVFEFLQTTIGLPPRLKNIEEYIRPLLSLPNQTEGHIVLFSAHSCDLLLTTPTHLSSEGCKASVMPRCFGSHTDTKESETRVDRADCVICSVRAQRDAERTGQGAAVQNGGVLRECMLEKFKGRFSQSVNRKYQHSARIRLSGEQRIS